jgi:chromosomal replication initiation ATPase DnaA
MSDTRFRRTPQYPFISRARHVACYFCVRHFHKTLNRTALTLGIDFTSCRYGANKIAREIGSNEAVRDDVDILRLRMHDLVWRRVRGMTCH